MRILASVRFLGMVPVQTLETVPFSASLSYSGQGVVSPGVIAPGVVVPGDSPPPFVLHFDGQVDATVGGSFPGSLTTREQVLAPFVIRIGGVELPYAQRLFGAWVEENIGGPPTWGFTLLARGELAGGLDLGTLEANFGPPASWRNITIDALYLTSAGGVPVRMLTDGVVGASERQVGGPDGDLYEVSGGGAWMRYDQQTVEVAHPPGHGLLRSELVDGILDAIGWDNRGIGQLPRDRRLYKEFQAVNDNALELCRRVLRAGACDLYEDRYGMARVRDILPPVAPIVAGTFTLSDLLTGTVRESAEAAGPPRVRVTTTQQLIQEGVDAGYKTVETLRELRQLYRPRRPDAKIATGGPVPLELEDSGLSSWQLKDRIVRRERVLQTFYLGTVVSEVKTVSEWFMRERAAGESAPAIVVAQPIDVVNSALILSVNSGTGAYSLVDHTSEVTQVDDFTMAVGAASGVSPAGVLRFNYDSQLAETIEVDVQQNSYVHSWYENAYVDTATGRAVIDDTEHFALTNRETLTREFDDRGYISRETKSTEGNYLPKRAIGRKRAHGSVVTLWEVDLLLDGTGVYPPVSTDVFEIDSIELTGSYEATVTTVNPHLLTAPATVNIGNVDQAPYNGLHGVLSITSATEFVMFVDGSPPTPATGDNMVGQKVYFGPSTAYERFVPLTFDDTRFTVNDEGFVTAQTTLHYAFTRRSGRSSYAWQYTDGEVHRRALEEFELTRRSVTEYIASEDGSQVTAITTHYDKFGNVFAGETVVQNGYLPAAERVQTPPDPLLYPNAVIADREEQQEVIADVTSEELLSVREDWTLEITDEGLEDVFEAETMGRLVLVEQSAAGLRWRLPLHAGVTPGKFYRLDLRPFGREYTVRAEKVRHSEEPGDPKAQVTSVTSSYFLIAIGEG